MKKYVLSFLAIAATTATFAHATTRHTSRKPADTDDTSVIQIQSGASSADKSTFYVTQLTVNGTNMDAYSDKPRLLIHGAQTLNVSAILDDGSEVVVGTIDKAVGDDAGRAFTRQLNFSDTTDTEFSTMAPIEILTCSDTMAVVGAFMNISLKYPHVFKISVSDSTKPNQSLTIKDQEFVKYLRQDIALGQNSCPPNFSAGKSATITAPTYPTK